MGNKIERADFFDRIGSFKGVKVFFKGKGEQEVGNLNQFRRLFSVQTFYQFGMKSCLGGSRLIVRKTQIFYTGILTHPKIHVQSI